MGCSLDSADVLVDAVLGTGIKLPLKPPVEEIYVRVKKRLKNPPGGRLSSRWIVPPASIATPARRRNKPYRRILTVTLGAAKTGLLSFPSAEFVGSLIVANIGLPEKMDSLFGPGPILADGNLVPGLAPAATAQFTQRNVRAGDRRRRFDQLSRCAGSRRDGRISIRRRLGHPGGCKPGVSCRHPAASGGNMDCFAGGLRRDRGRGGGSAPSGNRAGSSAGSRTGFGPRKNNRRISQGIPAKRAGEENSNRFRSSRPAGIQNTGDRARRWWWTRMGSDPSPN